MEAIALLALDLDEQSARYLPLRPRPIDGELATGYLVRVASANGYESPWALQRALVDVGCRSVDNLFEQLRLDRGWQTILVGPFPHYWKPQRALPAGLRSDDFNHHFIRWCPACLLESAHWRGEWALKLNCVCVRHGLRLMDQCPQCSVRTRMERGSTVLCTCGYSLAQARSMVACKPLIHLHEALMLEWQRPTGKADFGLKPEHWIKMVRYLGAFHTEPAPAHLGKAPHLHEYGAALALTTGTANLLADWPQAFHAMLTRNRAEFGGATHIGDAFGALYRVLYRELSAPCFEFLREAFENYLSVNWFGLLGRRNRRLKQETLARHQYKPLAAIANDAGTGRSVVRHLASAGVVDGMATKHGSGRVTWSIPMAEVERIRMLVDDAMTLREVVTALGVGRRRVRELVGENLLRAWLNPQKSATASWLISRADVHKLATIGFQLCLEVEPVREMTDVAHVCKTWQIRSDEFAALVRALLSGAVQARGRVKGKAGLGGVAMLADEARQWLTSSRLATDMWLSVDAAARLLAVKQQVAYGLITRGLLGCTSRREGARVCRRVSREDISLFQATFVSLAELAEIQHKSVRTLLRELRAAPACGPSMDGFRQYFYRRAEVAELLDESHQDLVKGERND